MGGHYVFANLLSCWRVIVLLPALAAPVVAQDSDAPTPSTTRDIAADGPRHRVIVSTDIGGTDPDDFQSMVHLLVYSDMLDIEGLIASPYGPGRASDILRVIDCYEKDFANLSTHSKSYPTPDALRLITKQGEAVRAPYSGVRSPTEGSKWIIECARRDDPRPLHVLVWGGPEDLAQALHDAPDILPRLRVYWIGGPNKKWGPDAYQYIVDNHPELWIIESNATYRGWFTGGNQSGGFGNERFASQSIQGKGALGEFFVKQKSEVKMGDTPSVGWLLNGKPDDPTEPGWGGRYVRAWTRPQLTLHRLPSETDRIEVFGILELRLPVDDMPEGATAVLSVENQELPGHVAADGSMCFRFCPKADKRYRFRMQSNVSSLDGQTGLITAHVRAPSKNDTPDIGLPNWWTDDNSVSVSEGRHQGAKTVSRWREDFLQNFAARMQRCNNPSSHGQSN